MKKNHLLSNDPRVAAAQLLSAVILGETSLANISHYNANLSTKDKALMQTISYGCCRHYETILGCITQLMRKPLREKDTDVLALMIIGCYQLNYMRIPEHAAINTSVNACRTIKKPWACKVVNAVLRNYQRQHKTLIDNLQAWQGYSHPQWLVSNIQASWPEQATAIFHINNQQAPMCLRVSNQYSREAYQEMLAEHDIASTACELTPKGLRLAHAVGVDALPGFTTGSASIQDEAAQLAALLLDPQDGETVLDACAAPGGKSCHILELADVSLTAMDIDTHRCDKIHENLQRLNLHAMVQISDAAQPDTWWNQTPFDRILLDAPCSATGVIRRHPDIKLLRHEQDIIQLVQIQQRLLTQLWSTLKSGGRLVYATCSILKEENEKQIESFLEKHQDAKSLSIAADWGVELSQGRQILPQANGADGFYYAILEKQ